MKRSRDKSLHRLARLHGVLTNYRDMNQHPQEAATDSLLAVLRTLGVRATDVREVPAALREERLAQARRFLEPIHVVWQRQRAVVPMQLPDRVSADPLRVEWQFEDGNVRRVDTRSNRLPLNRVVRAEGERFVRRSETSPARLPLGYHRLVLEVANDRFETLVICAPEQWPKAMLRPTPTNAAASLNTHDMPPFNAYRRGLDIEDRYKLGLVKRSGLPRERRQREKVLRNLIKLLPRGQPFWQNISIAGVVSQAVLAHLATGPARWVLVNLEDLWLEHGPQNVPGTSTERLNWRRKTRLALEHFQHDPAVRAQLRLVDTLRRQRAHRRRAFTREAGFRKFAGTI